MKRKEQSAVLYNQFNENEITDIDLDDNPMDIPDHAFDTLARGLMPILEEFYKVEKNQFAFEEWNAKQTK